MAPLLFVSFEAMLGAMFRRLFILSLSLLAACSTETRSTTSETAPAQADELLTVSVTRVESSKDSSTRLKLYTLTKDTLTYDARTLKGRPGPSETTTVKLTPEAVSDILDQARRNGFGTDRKPPDDLKDDPGIRTTYVISLDGHRYTLVMHSKLGGASAPPSPEVDAVEHLIQTMLEYRIKSPKKT